MKTLRVTRRHFFMGTAVFAVGCATNPVPEKRVTTKANDRLNIGVIGCGGRGGADIKALNKENIVALCDVDLRSGKGAFDSFPEAGKYRDFRVMLDKEAKNLDAVVVATPDHMHAVAGLRAMRMGKHVYVEKPMAQKIEEAFEMRKVAEEMGVVTQMGNQGHSMRGVWQLKDMMARGVVGKVREVHAWTNRPSWPQGIAVPTDNPPVPEYLDWNLWLGPAPERPYHPAYCPRSWRGWWEFGCGALGDMGCHILDAPYTALELNAPSRVSPESEGGTSESAPKWSRLTYEFPTSVSGEGVVIRWFDGGQLPPHPAIVPSDKVLGDGDGGTVFIGEHGVIVVGTYGGNPTIYPENLHQDYLRETGGEKMEGRNHWASWAEACKGGDNCLSHFDYAAPFTAVVHLGNVALQTGEAIEWDAAARRVTNVPEANAFVKRAAYREGFGLGQA